MAETSTSESSKSISNGDEAARKEALRKAGAEYFDKVLSQARCTPMWHFGVMNQACIADSQIS